MPALLIRMSRRLEWEVKSSAAFLMEAKEVRSSCMKVMVLFGTAFVMSEMAASAFEAVRAARKISLGECFASWRTVSLPRPVLPVSIH